MVKSINGSRQGYGVVMSDSDCDHESFLAPLRFCALGGCIVMSFLHGRLSKSVAANKNRQTYMKYVCYERNHFFIASMTRMQFNLTMCRNALSIFVDSIQLV